MYVSFLVALGLFCGSFIARVVVNYKAGNNNAAKGYTYAAIATATLIAHSLFYHI